jgi:hypothetical protein
MLVWNLITKRCWAGNDTTILFVTASRHVAPTTITVSTQTVYSVPTRLDAFPYRLGVTDLWSDSRKPQTQTQIKPPNK